MSAAKKPTLVAGDSYLEGELTSAVKHEYLGGVVYAMAGGRNQHNRIAGNVFGTLHSRLSASPCQPFNSDTKIRVRMPAHMRYYYPDVSVICEKNPEAEAFQDKPRIVFEVLSSRTRRIDEGEKKDAYLSIPTVSLYVLIEQETPALVVFRRTDRGFVREVYDGLDAVLPLPEIGTELLFSEIYARVEFTPDSDD